MKINHDFIRAFIRYFGIGLFLFAVVYKFKKVLNTKPEEVNDDEDAIDSPTVVYKNEQPNSPTSEVATPKTTESN